MTRREHLACDTFHSNVGMLNSCFDVMRDYLQALSIMHDLERWSDVRKLLERPGKITGADFEPDPAILEFLQSDAQVLVVGAGVSPVFSSNAMYNKTF